MKVAGLTGPDLPAYALIHNDACSQGRVKVPTGGIFLKRREPASAPDRKVWGSADLVRCQGRRYSPDGRERIDDDSCAHSGAYRLLSFAPVALPQVYAHALIQAHF